MSGWDTGLCLSMNPRLVPIPAVILSSSPALPPLSRVIVRAMNRVLSVLIVLILLVLGGGMAVLAAWDLPAPSKTVEKVLPDDRFPR